MRVLPRPCPGALCMHGRMCQGLAASKPAPMLECQDEKEQDMPRMAAGACLMASRLSSQWLSQGLCHKTIRIR